MEVMTARDLASLFPVGAAASLASDDWVPQPYPEELALLGSAAPQRVQEFILGRECARRALAQLGIAPAPLLRGVQRQPLWPQGTCGSITHCDGLAAAVASVRSTYSALGLDAERRHRPLSPAVVERISSQEERTAFPGDVHAPWELLLFSAKESIFKVWFPLRETMLGFREADVRFDPATSSFRARILVPGAPEWIEGRYLCTPEYVVTGAYLTPAAP